VKLNSTERTILEKIKAAYPALYVVSAEIQRTIADLRTVSSELNRDLYIWTVSKGLCLDHGVDQPPGTAIEGTDGPDVGLFDAILKLEEHWKTAQKEAKEATKGRALPGARARLANEPAEKFPGGIIVLKLYHHFLDNVVVQPLLLDAIQHCKSTKKTLIILTPVLKIPTELEKDIALIELQLPDKAEMREVLKGIAEGSKVAMPNPEVEKQLIESAMGLTTNEAENAFALSLVRSRSAGKPAGTWDPDVVLEEKCQALRKSGLLEYYPSSHQGMGSIGGLDNLKAWVARRRKAFGEEATAFGLSIPKGVLTVGIQGTGKSATARALSEELRLPLLRCDMGKIFAGLVGASEANARLVIQTAEALAPCVLWLDEIEKGLAGAKGGGQNDSGVGARVFGTFLTWMQEKTKAVFVYATANRIDMLPPEFLRKGRFDEIFSIDLPNAPEREEIFRIHLKKRGREGLIGDTINLKSLVNDSEDYSGAEIEAAINEALYTAFDEGQRKLTTQDIIKALGDTFPLSKTMAEDIKALRKFCETRTRSANTQVQPTTLPIGHGRMVDIGQA
jgi:hypothetical protein